LLVRRHRELFKASWSIRNRPGPTILQFDNLIEGSDLFKAVGDVEDALSRVGSQHVMEQS